MLGTGEGGIARMVRGKEPQENRMLKLTRKVGQRKDALDRLGGMERFLKWFVCSSG